MITLFRHNYASDATIVTLNDDDSMRLMVGYPFPLEQNFKPKTVAPSERMMVWVD